METDPPDLAILDVMLPDMDGFALCQKIRYNHPLSAEREEFDFRGLQISKATHKCLLYGEELALTPLEFSILWYLCEKRGQVVSSEELFQAVWGEKYLDSNNTVISHIARLREKMGESRRKPKFVKTVWGWGIPLKRKLTDRFSVRRNRSV